MSALAPHGKAQRWWTRAIPIAMVSVLLLVALLGVLFVEQSRSVDRQRAAEIASQERRALMMEVLSAHQDVETGQRGYVISGRANFLEPYTEGRETLDRVFPRLRREYAGDADQLGRIDTLELVSHAKRDFSAEVVELRRDGRYEDAAAQISSGAGKVLMDEIRHQVAVIIGLETVALRSAEQATGASIVNQRWGAGATIALLLLLLVCANVAVWITGRARQRALVALEDTSQRQRAVFDGAMDAILTLNPSGTIESANAAATRIFGYSFAEIDRRDAALLFAHAVPIGAVSAALRAQDLEVGQRGTLDKFIARRKDGTTFPASVATTVANLEEGVRYIAVVRDITESDRVDRMKSEFVSTVSHELRTPLTSIAGSLGLLAGGAAGELSEKPARLIAIAKNNADRLVRLINDILDIEKLESGTMRFDNQSLDLGDELADAAEAMRGFADGYGVDIVLDASTGLAASMADRDRLAQVFTNLLSNAVKFSPAGGRVHAAVVPGPLVHRVTIRDEGPGIPDEFRDRIFGKFAQADSSDTRAKGGTGLGLSIVREIATRLGGSVGFDSEPGKGATFFVDLPADRTSLHGEADAPEGRLLLCGGAGARKVATALDRENFAVFLAASVEEALPLLRGQTFDVVLLEMTLPDGQAIEMIQEMRNAGGNADIPILAIGDLDREDRVGDAAWVLDWLNKPIQPSALVARLEDVLTRRPADRPRVLHVDDDPDVLRIVATAFEGRTELTSVPSLSAARRALSSATFDLVILDLTLRDGRGFELIESLRDPAGIPIPIVVFSAEDADVVDAERFAAFLTKSRTPIENLVGIVERMATDRRRMAA